jgi:hypothetical protein
MEWAAINGLVRGALLPTGVWQWNSQWLAILPYSTNLTLYCLTTRGPRALLPVTSPVENGVICVALYPSISAVTALDELPFLFPSFLLTLGLLGACQTQRSADPASTTTASAATTTPVWQSAAYTLYRDRVVQGRYEARAVSATELVSNYQSPANETQSPQVEFKFSLNGKDNEMTPGLNHLLVAAPRPGGAAVETPPIVFGQRYVDATPAPANAYLAPNTAVKIQLDLRPVLAAFKKDGFYTTFKGDKLYQQDFKHVYVAGGAAPLSWDFDNLGEQAGAGVERPRRRRHLRSHAGAKPARRR